MQNKNSKRSRFDTSFKGERKGLSRVMSATNAYKKGLHQKSVTAHKEPKLASETDEYAEVSLWKKAASGQRRNESSLSMQGSQNSLERQQKVIRKEVSPSTIKYLCNSL